MLKRLILAAVFSCSLISIQKLYAGAAASAPDNYGGGPTPSPTPDRTPGDGGGDGGGGGWNPSPSPTPSSPSPSPTGGDGGGDGYTDTPNPTPTGGDGGGGDTPDTYESDNYNVPNPNDTIPDDFAGPGVNALNAPMPRGEVTSYQLDAMRAGVEAVREAAAQYPVNNQSYPYDSRYAEPISPGTNGYSQTYNRAYFGEITRFKAENPTYPGVGEIPDGPYAASRGEVIGFGGLNNGPRDINDMAEQNRINQIADAIDRAFVENPEVMLNVPGVLTYTPPPGTVPPGYEGMLRLGLASGVMIVGPSQVLNNYGVGTQVGVQGVLGAVRVDDSPLPGGLAVVATDRPPYVNSVVNHEVGGHVALYSLNMGLDSYYNIDFSAISDDVIATAREIVENMYERPPNTLPYNNIEPERYNVEARIQEGLQHVYSNWHETIGYGATPEIISNHLQSFGGVPQTEADRVAEIVHDSIGEYVDALNQVANVLVNNIDSSGNYLTRVQP